MTKELFRERKWNRDGEVFFHRQVFFNGEVYIYEVSQGTGKWYEVFKRRERPLLVVEDGKMKKHPTDTKIAYPSNEDFGKWAKNCTDLEGDKWWCAMYWVRKWSSGGSELGDSYGNTTPLDNY